MAIKVIEATAPVAWGSYMVNGDATSFSLHEDGDEEIAAIDAWLDSMAPARMVCATGEPEFAAHHDAWAFWPYAAEVVTYSFQLAN